MSVEYTNGNTIGMTNGVKYVKLYDNRRFITNDLVNQLEEKMNDSQVEKFRINKVIENAIHWCLVNGFVLVPKSRKQEDLMVVTYLPFTLFPTPFKKAHFQQVIDLQPHVNELFNKISTNVDFMQKSFENLTVIDHFLGNLWSLYKKAKMEGYNQQINLSILRTDYMLHQRGDHISMKQVEINTIAAGFGYVSTKATMLHREILKWTNNYDALNRIPNNEPVVKMAQGFAKAWQLYDAPSSIVLFIVLDIEINIADQRHLEYEIKKQEPSIEIHRCTLIELNKYGRLGEDKTLYFYEREVSIVYFRAGYDPSHYESQIEWDTLYKIEISKAIKCPNIGTFLAGMKKIQESISIDKNLEIFCNSNKNLLKSVFADFFLLNTNENMEKVLENPENYVLKPQREGGGNNFYNQEIVSIVNRIKSIETCLNGNVNGKKIMEDRYNKNFYIVMEYLRPFVSYNYIISSKYQQQQYKEGQQGNLEKKKITNELGVYGVFVKNGEDIVMNETCGYCLRSKLAEDNEAGVMCGSGALDTVYLID